MPCSGSVLDRSFSDCLELHIEVDQHLKYRRQCCRTSANADRLINPQKEIQTGLISTRNFLLLKQATKVGIRQSAGTAGPVQTAYCGPLITS